MTTYKEFMEAADKQTTTLKFSVATWSSEDLKALEKYVKDNSDDISLTKTHGTNYEVMVDPKAKDAFMKKFGMSEK